MGRYRKTIVAVIGLVVQIAQSGLLPLTPTGHAWVTAAIAVLTAAGVYQVRNSPPKPPESARLLGARTTPPPRPSTPPAPPPLSSGRGGRVDPDSIPPRM